MEQFAKQHTFAGHSFRPVRTELEANLAKYRAAFDKGASHFGWHGQTCLPVLLRPDTGKLALVHGTLRMCHPFWDESLENNDDWKHRRVNWFLIE